MTMTKYYKTGADGKPQEITRQEAEEMARRNKELFETGDFQKMLEIEVPLKMEV